MSTLNSLKAPIGVENRGVLEEARNLIAKVARTKLGKAIIGTICLGVGAIAVKNIMDKSTDEVADFNFKNGSFNQNQLVINNPPDQIEFSSMNDDLNSLNSNTQSPNPEISTSSNSSSNYDGKLVDNSTPITKNNPEVITEKLIERSNILNNGEISLAFYEDHVSYTFSDAVKKAINDNGGSAGSFMYTNATTDNSELSADGDVTSNAGHLKVPKLNNGIFTFVVSTVSGDFRITGALEDGLPAPTENRNDYKSRLIANNAELTK